jgi:hypothetical protein
MHLARLAVRLEDARNTVRGLLGEDYDDRVAHLRKELREIAAARRKSVLAVGVEAAKRIADDRGGMAALLVLAATVDEMEAAP